MKLLVIVLLTLSASAKDINCSKLLRLAISDYNNARFVKTESKKDTRILKTMYANRSVAGSNLADICIKNILDGDDAEDLKIELRKIK